MCLCVYLVKIDCKYDIYNNVLFSRKLKYYNLANSNHTRIENLFPCNHYLMEIHGKMSFINGCLGFVELHLVQLSLVPRIKI